MSNTASGFEILDHPADMGISLWAETLSGLFELSAQALTSILVDLEAIDSLKAINIWLSADDEETLLYNWLSEILYLFDGEKLLFSKFSVNIQNNKYGKMQYNNMILKSTCQGEFYQESKHQLKTYVKAITFHQLKIEHNEHGERATVYLDI